MVANPAFLRDIEEEKRDIEDMTGAASDKAYSYAEAIELAGNGWYSMSLVAALSLALLAMALDMFSFALVVSLSACDLLLTPFRSSVLVSMPFVGSIVMAYAWGYISDTRGRRRSLLAALGGGCVASAAGALAPHWAALALCRLLSTCFCSCAQSATYTLLGESCPERVRGGYMLVMTSVIHLNLCIYYPLAYFITIPGFSYDLGFINFLPWRLLVLILALPLGVSALLLFFFYESPKFLLNAGREEEAIDLLRRIYGRNGGNVDNYPVKRLYLDEAGNVEKSGEETSLLRALWRQTAPLFRRPLLGHTLLIYFLIFALYSSNSALMVWLPFFAESFSVGTSINSEEKIKQGLCEMIHQPQANNNTSLAESCTTVIELPIVLGTVGAGVSYCLLNALISRLAARKRLVMMTTFFVSFLSGIGSIVIRSNISSVILYFGFLLNSLNMGVVFSYCVDLYPTSFRGMAACLGVMVARLSGIAGVNITGPFISSQCDATFYALSLLMLSAAIMSYLLPRDLPKKN